MKRIISASLLLLFLTPALSFAGWDDPPGVPPLDPDLLAEVQDGRAIGTVSKNEPEAEAYCEALRKAWKTPPEAFARAARHDLTYGHLFEEPAKYRGQVVHVQGRLVRLRRLDAPLTVKDLGADYLYEGWVFDHHYRNNPWCILFTTLPAGIEIGEKVEYPVTFDGYFFKRYRYKAADNVKPEEGREVPLLIGPTITLQRPTVAASSANPTGWWVDGLPFILTLLGVVAVLVVGLTWIYRRGDQKIRARLAARTTTFVVPGSEPEMIPDSPNPEGSIGD